MTTLSLLICTQNRADHLRQTLESLAAVEVPAEISSELIIVDNGSTDETKQVIEQSPVRSMPTRYVFEAKRGVSNARNAGLAASTAKIIVFTDDDLRFGKDWIAKITAPILDGTAQAVAGHIRLAPALERPWMTRDLRALLAETDDAQFREKFFLRLVGANMAFKRDILAKVPEFDRELGAGALGSYEETLFSKQAQAAGFIIAYQPEARVEHHFDPGRLTRDSLLDAAIKTARSEAYFQYHWEHMNLPSARMRILRKTLQLGLWRATHKEEMAAGDRLSETEYWYVRELERLRHFALVEAVRPRNYERHGLVKLR